MGNNSNSYVGCIHIYIYIYRQWDVFFMIYIYIIMWKKMDYIYIYGYENGKVSQRVGLPP